MKTVNKSKSKTAIALLIGLAISGCGQKSAEEHIAESKIAIENNEYAKAIVNLKNAVRLSPKEAGFRVLLGIAYLKSGLYVNAEKELSKALELGESSPKVVVGLAKAMAYSEDMVGLKELEANSGTLDDFSYANISFYAGVGAYLEGDILSGNDYFNQVKAIDENSKFATLSEAYILFRQEQFNQALTLLTGSGNIESNDDDTILLLGHLHFGAKDYESAVKYYKKHLELVPSYQVVTFYLTNTLLRQGKYEEADKLSSDLVSKFESSPLANQYKSQILFHQKDYQGALAFAEKALQNNATLHSARIIAGLSAYQLDSIEVSYNYLKPLEKYLPKEHLLNRILGSSKLKLGYFDDADNNFDNLNHADIDLLKKTGLELFDSGNIEGTRKLIEKAQSVAADDAFFKAQKGLLQIISEDIKGIDTLEEVLNEEPSLTNLELTLVMQYIKVGSLEKAESAISKILQESGPSPIIHLLKGLLFIKKQDLVNAKKSFEMVLDNDSNNITARYNLAVIAEEQNDMNSAINFYKDVLKINSEHSGSIRRLAQLLDDSEASIEYFKGLSSNDSSNIKALIGQSIHLRASGKSAEAVTLLEKAYQNTSTPDKNLIRMLGDSLLQNNETEKAHQIFADGVKQFPQDYVLRIRNIGVLEVLGRYDESLALTRNSLISFPNNQNLKLLESYYLMLTKQFDESRLTLKSIFSEFGESGFYTKVKGLLAFTSKNYDEAISVYKHLNDKFINAEYAVNLARAYQFKGNTNKAAETLEAFLKKRPNDDSTRAILASLYSSHENAELGLRHYRLLESKYPNNPALLNNIAWQSHLLGINGVALEYIEKVVSVAPNVDTFQINHGVILAANGQFERAIKLLEVPARLGHLDGFKKLSLINAYLKLDKIEEAKILFSSISEPTIVANSEYKRLQALL